jgi:putative membrane protein
MATQQVRIPIMKYRLLFPAAAALALAACGSSGSDSATTDADAASTDTTMADQAATTPDPSAESAMPTDSQGFVDKASASDMFEIEAGKLAQKMGKAKAVKDFGAMMVADHTKSSSELKTAAGTAQGVTVAPKLTAMQQSNLDALKGAGDNFDATYKQQQIAAHEQTLSLLQGYSQNGDNEALKGFASKTAPVVEGHLAEARKL